MADELSGAATLVMGQGDESVPAVLVRGYAIPLWKRTLLPALRLPQEQQLYHFVRTVLREKVD